MCRIENDQSSHSGAIESVLAQVAHTDMLREKGRFLLAFLSNPADVCCLYNSPISCYILSGFSM
jgi:hypothetical protein